MAKWIYKKCNLVTTIDQGMRLVKNGTASYAEVSVPFGTMKLYRKDNFLLGRTNQLEKEIDYLPASYDGGSRVDIILDTGYDELNPNVYFILVNNYHYDVDSGKIIVSYKGDIYKYYKDYLYSKGSFIEEISAEEGTLPNNGRHTDGYWYVKDRIAISSQIKIDGVVRDIVGYELKGYGVVSLQFKDDNGIIHDI